MTSVNVAKLLAVCVRASLAAQRYVMLSLIKLPNAEANMTHVHSVSPATSAAHPCTVLDLSEAGKAILMDSLHHAVSVDVKSHLDHKEGDAADDFVTTADILIQAVVLRALSESFPAFPFTVVGEEDQPSSAVAKEVEACMATHYRILAMPYEAELYASIHAGDACSVDAEAAVVLHADSDEAMRRRLGIFIDPIDATNCFVTGAWQAPMTLVGITLDGVPIAGVMNRIFHYPLRCTDDPAVTETPVKSCVPGLSVVLNTPALASPFVVFDGELLPGPMQIEPQPECTRKTTLAVCCSSTTKELFLQRLLTQLEPCSPVHARGAGYKQYHLLKKMLKGRHVPHEVITPADVFVCPPAAIKKWDCCAPHAFLYTFGGDIFDRDGAPLRYPLIDACGAAVSSSSESSVLTNGLVAVTPYAKTEVARRLGWTPTLVQ
ncbi:Inositol monophosphatase family [Leishmania braziliensis]|nr:Inositol monophosphatase family [Leishmania braziliensis]